ncbi:ABC transporter substrate-binding protein [Methanospirillum lacunae]|uniref:Fe/B12 periplasmic-binding domain-containing protein n=1 Tax=Methanospirillum lacunae TaxID=668570 RepID=A0A2V2MYD3_9EURY|nr:ABC transporter substrate-binding protein [Methanospirillum lacunae]PWR71315.1 hypothetical protein DK846_10635 [Methanospirillum lacunae]
MGKDKPKNRKTNYYPILSILAILAIVFLTVTPISAAETQSGDTRTVVDAMGNTVVIPKTVDKIVALYGACSAPYVLSGLGAGDKLIGGLCFKTPMQVKVQPEYDNLETYKVQEYEGNIEELLKLKPDVVFGWYTLKNEKEMRDAGIPLVMLKSTNLSDEMKNIQIISEITNTQDTAKQLIDYFNDTVKKVGDKVSTIPETDRKKVLVLSKVNPIKAMGADARDGDLIRKAGGSFVTDKMPGFTVDLNMEEILKLDPDYIIVSPTGKTNYDDIMNNTSAWDSVRAKKEGHVYQAPIGVFYWDKSQIEPNLYLLWLTNLLYPDIISNETLKDEAKDYYKKFFAYDLTDEDYNAIMTHSR